MKSFDFERKSTFNVCNRKT